MSNEELTLFLKYYDEKLQDLLTADEYHEWCRQTAVKVFKASIDFVEDHDFREFIRENFTAITGARMDEVKP